MRADIHNGQEHKRSVQGRTRSARPTSPNHHFRLATRGRSMQMGQERKSSVGDLREIVRLARGTFSDERSFSANKHPSIGISSRRLVKLREFVLCLFYLDAHFSVPAWQVAFSPRWQPLRRTAHSATLINRPRVRSTSPTQRLSSTRGPRTRVLRATSPRSSPAGNRRQRHAAVLDVIQSCSQANPERRLGAADHP